MAPRLMDETVMQRATILLTIGPSGLIQVSDGLANDVQRCVGRQGRTERNRDRVRNPLWQTPVAGRGEDTAGQAVKMNGNDRVGPALDDALEPTLKWGHQARSRESGPRETGKPAPRCRVRGRPRETLAGSSSGRR